MVAALGKSRVRVVQLVGRGLLFSCLRRRLVCTALTRDPRGRLFSPCVSIATFAKGFLWLNRRAVSVEYTHASEI